MKHALGAGLAALLLLGSAHAAPNIWRRAADPRAAREQAALVRLERRKDDSPNPEPALIPQESMRTLLLLSIWQIDLDQMQDARVCFFLGDAVLDLQGASPADARTTLAKLLKRRPDDALHEAKKLLERALASAPASPLAADGQFDLALIEGQLGQHPAERSAYLRAISLYWDGDQRAIAYQNLAESDMRADDLKTALREFRLAAANVIERQDVLALAYYGLAVALERSGDFPRGLALARQANHIQLAPGIYAAQNALDLPTNTFEPAYEAHYYKALAAMAAAQDARDREAQRDELANAIEHWEAYLVMAEVDHSPWLQNARLREARARRDLKAVEEH